MRKAKEVKVINRWRADDFNGEIPIGGDDEEMLGAAIKIADHMSGIPEAIESAKPAVKTAVWLNAHVLGAIVGTTAATKIGLQLSDPYAEDISYGSLKVNAAKIGYGLGSVIGDTFVNGNKLKLGSKSVTSGKIFRAITTLSGSSLIGIQVGLKTFETGSVRRGRLAPMKKRMRYGAIGCYMLAGASLAYTKLQERS
ncbi:hypothetical protein N9X64_00210 [bacterium]|nr:hypothetical protein [bacterium]